MLVGGKRNDLIMYILCLLNSYDIMFIVITYYISGYD